LAGYIIGIAVLELIIFLMIRFTILGREYIFANYVRTRATSGEKLDEWENVERPPTPIAI
jgi:hypothetical protein